MMWRALKRAAVKARVLVRVALVRQLATVQVIHRPIKCTRVGQGLSYRGVISSSQRNRIERSKSSILLYAICLLYRDKRDVLLLLTKYLSICTAMSSDKISNFCLFYSIPLRTEKTDLERQDISTQSLGYVDSFASLNHTGNIPIRAPKMMVKHDSSPH